MRTADSPVVIFRVVTILLMIKLAAHHVIQSATAETQDFPEWFTEVPVEGCVDDRIEGGVDISKPVE